MKVTKRTILCLGLCIGLITIYLILITLFSGFRHEYKKFKQFLLTLVAILLIRYLILDHIVFHLLGAFLALKGQEEAAAIQAHDEIKYEDENCDFRQIEFFKLHLESLKSQLCLSPSHRDESLNLKYKLLTEELWLFGKYFFLLLLVVVYSRNSYSYYNTTITRRLLNESYFSNYKLESVLTISDLYDWINDTLTAALSEGYEYDGSPIDEPGWLHFHQSKLLGVVRLQQIRHAKRGKSMAIQYFDEENYLPGWKMLNKSLPYVEKYWRIYQPWLPKKYADITSWLLGVVSMGSLYTYSENNGYVVLLARDQKNSAKILKFLKENNWLDANTAALFIDFTLYNADSNLFTICSILVEQTPFGNLLWKISVQSAELLWNMNEISMWWWCLIVFYTLQMLQFVKVMIVRSWFESGFFRSRWNYVDFFIVLLNTLLLCFILLREYFVLDVMKEFVLAKKQEHVSFRVACLFNYMANVTLGFLVCLASLRVWKVLQFSSIFRMFNRTLYTSAIPLLSTILGINIFLCAIGKSAQILHGSHSEIFSGYFKSITSVISFSFGFNSATRPEDLIYGGNIYGFVLYLILMFVVAIFLINMFITLICDHFARARERRDQESPDYLSYWQFFVMEYSFIRNYFEKLFPAYKKTNDRTVNENVNDHVGELEKKLESKKLDNKSELESERTDRIKNVAAVLNLQMEVLDRLITLECVEWNLEEDSD